MASIVPISADYASYFIILASILPATIKHWKRHGCNKEAAKQANR